MKIIIDPLDSESVEEALREIRKLKAKVEAYPEKLLNAIVDDAARKAEEGFAGATYTGKNDVRVTTEVNNNEAVIKASGENVAFIEFGTGVAYEEHPYGASMGLTHGSYGKGKGNNPKGWVFKGEPGNAYTKELKDGVYWTKGQPPARAMYEAGKLIKEETAMIAKEVWKNE
jgi:hypothetical protein